jgi:hypothetical protein
MFSPVTIVSACALLAMIGLLTALPVCLWSIPRRYRADRPLLARKRRALRVLLSAQAAVAIFLLVCTGLFLHALSLLTSQDFGVRSKDLYLISLAGQRGSRDSLQDYDYFHQLIDRINHVSGVRRSALLDGVFFLPPGGMPTTVRSSSIGRDVQARLHCASPGLFMTLGTPILDGREFSISDGKGSPRVAIVNAELARILFGSSRLASRSIEMPAFTPALVQVVGVVANIKHGSMREATTPDLYIPCEQRWAAADLLDAASLVVQYRQGAGEHTRETVAALIETFGRQLPVKQAPLDGLLRGSLSSERFLAILGLLFAAIALCAFGLAILSSTVLLRTAPEFPSPFLLPKNSSQPVQLSRRHVLLPLLPGAALGVLGALLLLYSHHAGTIFAGQATTCSACTVTPQGVSLAETYLFHPNRYITCVIVSIAVTLVFILAGVMTIIAGGASWLPSSPVRTRLDL